MKKFKFAAQLTHFKEFVKSKTVQTFYPFITIIFYLIVVLFLPEEYYRTATSYSLLLIALAILLSTLLITNSLNRNMLTLFDLLDGQKVISENQKATYDLLINHNTAMITVTQHQATEKIVTDKKHDEQFEQLDLGINLIDSRLQIVQNHVEGNIE